MWPIILKNSEKNTSFVTIFMILLQLSKAQILINFNESSCHSVIIKDDLPSADARMHFFPVKSIFFIETSCKGTIKSRQACSIESAALAHPNWQINVLFTGPVPKEIQEGKTMTVLKNYPNIKFFRIHVSKFTRNSPLEHLLTKTVENVLQCHMRHSADMLKLIVLYRWSGVYMDMDVIVIKSFDKLAKNWVSRVSDTEIGSSYLGISGDKVGKQFVNSVMALLDKSMMELSFANKSGSLSYTYPILHVLKYICTETNVTRMSADTCQGFEVYHQKYFNPVHHTKWFYFFKPGNVTWSDVYALHTWSYLNENAFISPSSPFMKLAKTFCPTVFKEYSSDWESKKELNVTRKI